MISETDARTLAAEIVSQSWEDAISKGISAELFASTNLSAALASLVEIHGADAAARMMERFAEAVRAGKFSHHH